MNSFRILIADDHEIVRRGIRSLLESHAGWEVCGEARDGREAVELCGQLDPDLILLDIEMPGLNGLEVARRTLSISPRTRVLILTIHDSEEVVREAVAVGARGFVLKSDLGRNLVTAVEALQHKRTFLTPRFEDLPFDGLVPGCHPRGFVRQSRLTPPEREVVQLLAEGKTNRQVAVTLSLSVKTADTHRTNIMRKLHLHSVADLTLYAVRNGLIQVL